MSSFFNSLMAASLIISLLLLCHSVTADDHLVNTDPQSNAAKNPTSPIKIDCGGECARRCQLSSRPRLCKRACGTCCQRCNCVPPGTSGNHYVCPCYASMTTHGGRLKCP